MNIVAGHDPTLLSIEIIDRSCLPCSNMTSRSLSFIGNIYILTEYCVHFEVLFLLSINWSCVFEVKRFILNIYDLIHKWKRKQVSNVNMSVPKSKLKGNFGLLYLNSFWLVFVFSTFPSWKLIVALRVVFYAKKILNYLGCLEVRILVE